MLEKICYGVLVSAAVLMTMGIGVICLYSSNDNVKKVMDDAVAKIVVKMEENSELENTKDNNISNSNMNVDYEELIVNNESNGTEDLNTNDMGTESLFNNDTENEDNNHVLNQEEEKKSEYYFSKGYSNSSELYFNIEKNRAYGIDQEQLDLMAKFNTLADEIEKQGNKQPDLDLGVLSKVNVKYYGENTYINPYEESPLRNCYVIEGMRIPYYVDEEYGHIAGGIHEWEVVLNYFMDGILTFLNVKEAKKFVDVDSAYLMAEPGEDVYKHIKNTDKCIAAMLLQTSSAVATVENSNGRYLAQGSYYLDNIVNIPYNGTEIARATVKVLFMRLEAAEVLEEKMVELDQSRTYISTYVDDPNTGKKYCFGYKFATRQFEVSMLKDNNGDWKIVCVEP